MRSKKILVMAECAIMIALAFALSWVTVWKMLMGGSVTLASMLPIMFIGIKYGPKIGVGTAFLYSLTQLAQAIIQGDVFIYCQSGVMVAVCVLFDYLLPFTVLGLAGIFTSKSKLGAYVGMAAVTAARFICHFVSGVAIWGQWAPEGMNKFVYSILYNGSFLALDFAICIAVAIPLLQVRQMRKLLGLSEK
jgi:thiamine transporter